MYITNEDCLSQFLFVTSPLFTDFQSDQINDLNLRLNKLNHPIYLSDSLVRTFNFVESHTSCVRFIFRFIKKSVKYYI